MPSGFLLLINLGGKRRFQHALYGRCSHGLLCLIAKSIVFFEPPVSSGAIEKITLPSESRTFHSVSLEVVGTRQHLSTV